MFMFVQRNKIHLYLGKRCVDVIQAYTVTAFVLMITENKSVTVLSTSVHQKGLLL